MASCMHARHDGASTTLLATLLHEQTCTTTAAFLCPYMLGIRKAPSWPALFGYSHNGPV